jgi:tyrosinase
MQRVRKNVWTLPVADKTLDWYAAAVAKMKERPLADPLGWRYQAAVHGYPNANDDDTDPLSTPADAAGAPPPFWNQCQHATSFFLPWHRMYLLQFERIVGTYVASLGGPADWALPYWDTYKDLGWRLLPPAFRDPESSLYVEARNRDANAGHVFLDPEDVDLHPGLTARGDTDIGGFFGDPAPYHLNGHEKGQIESYPHDHVHEQLGMDEYRGKDASFGWMGDPNLAALDPIFWLHHANIDRLWEVWRRRDASHGNLTTEYWLQGVPFRFNAADGQIVSMTTVDVLDIAAPGLDYDYEDLSDPLAARATVLAAMAKTPSTPPTPPAHELVGATQTGVVLGDDVVHAMLPTPVTPVAFAASRRRAGAALGLAPAAPGAATPGRVVLRLEQVTSSGSAPAYDVFLDVPDGDDPGRHADLHVGRASMFGLVQASRRGQSHGGSGLTFSFDITALYGKVHAQAWFDPTQLRVSFVPVASRGVKADVHVGRISLYFA